MSLLRDIVVLTDDENRHNGYISFKTNVYKLHYLETPSCLRFVLLTDPSMETMEEPLRALYSQVYVEWVVKVSSGGNKENVLGGDSSVLSKEFDAHLQRFVRSWQGFSSEIPSMATS